MLCGGFFVVVVGCAIGTWDNLRNLTKLVGCDKHLMAMLEGN